MCPTISNSQSNPLEVNIHPTPFVAALGNITYDFLQLRAPFDVESIQIEVCRQMGDAYVFYVCLSFSTFLFFPYNQMFLLLAEVPSIIHTI